MGENLDFIGVMTYDLHGSWETKTGLHSPLFSATEEDDKLNIAWVNRNADFLPRMKFLIAHWLNGALVVI